MKTSTYKTKQKINNDKIIKNMMLVLTILLIVFSYAAGMGAKSDASDYLLIIAVCLTENELIWTIFRSKDKRTKVLDRTRQLLAVFSYVLFGVMACVIYKGKQFTWDFVSILVVISAWVMFATCFAGVRYLEEDIIGKVFASIREHVCVIVICGLFIIISMSEVISITQWDASFYMTSMDSFLQECDLTFKSVNSTSMGGHLSMGYALVAGPWHMLINYGNIGIKLCNIFMGCMSIFCFYGILKKQKINREICFAGTLLFAVSPMFLGLIGAVSMDYAMMVFFICFFYCFLEKKDILMTVYGILFLFTKETALVVYFFFWLGLLICRVLQKRRGKKVRWKDIKDAFKVNEWIAALLPTILLMLGFFICAKSQIGWPATIMPAEKMTGFFYFIVFSIIIAGAFAAKFFINMLCHAKYCLRVVWLLGVLIVVAVAVCCAVPQIAEKIVITDPTVFNRIGFSQSHILGILKQAYILNFSWIIVAGIIWGFIIIWRYRIRMSPDMTESLVLLMVTDAGVLIFSLVYVTYQNPRYMQIHCACIYMVLAILWGNIWKKERIKKHAVRSIVCAGLILLMCVESFMYIDPLTIAVFATRDIGRGVICGGDTDRLGTVSSCSSDRMESNRVYSYYMKSLVKFLKDINYDGSQIILFPKISNWVTVGRNDVESIDKELKCMIDYEGSFGDSVHMVKSLKEIETYASSGYSVYYVDMTAYNRKTDQMVAELYAGSSEVYSTGTWRITVYNVTQ